MIKNVPQPDALLMLIGGWFGLLLVASLVWMMLAMLSHHGAADGSKAAMVIFGPAALTAALSLFAFGAWLGRQSQLASGVVVTTMIGVLGALFYLIGALT